MQKRCCAAVCALFITAALGAQEGAGGALLNVDEYFSCFPIKANEDVSDNDYVWEATSEDYDRFSVIGRHDYEIDTPLEFALLSYYSQPVLNIRPVAAKNILPANTKTSELKLGAAVYQEMRILRFLGDTAAAGRHEGILQFITGRGNATGAEIEAYYHRHIGAHIAAVVDAEAKETSIPTVTLADIKQRISAFYLSPNQTTFNALKDFYDRINLEYMVLEMTRIYKNNISNITVFERNGWASSAASSREQAQEMQQQLIPVARARNMTFEQFVAFPWSDVVSVFRGSLDELNPALADRVTQAQGRQSPN
jgi:hypothetical protein